MANASSRALNSKVLTTRRNLRYQEGVYKYELRLEANRVLYTVTDGKKFFETQLDWVFGSGKMGQAYVFWRDGSWYETQVTFYGALNSLGRMLGGKPARDFDEAMGTRLPDDVARGCFSCHATGYNPSTSRRIDIKKLTPGVQCGQCHVGAETHAAQALMGKWDVAPMEHLSSLTTDGVSELCGKCHRTWSNIILNGPRGPDNVRFQPYRLANSKCYDGSDPRISCVACHDPHHELESSASTYDVKCLACHAGVKSKGSSRPCPVGTKECVSCHMPRYALPNTHEEFTDHQIRIVRVNEPYPN